MQAILDKYKIPNVLFALLIAYLLIIRMLLISSYSTDLDGAEFIFVYHIQRLIEHKPIYQNPTELPYLACLFVPIYLYILKVIISLFSASSQENIHFIYVVGRAFSFLLFAKQIIIFTWYVRKRFQSSWRMILCFVSIYLLLISGHMYVIRPDAMKFLFFTIAFILLIEYEFFNQRILYLIGFLLISVLNVFTKQDTIVYLCILIGCMILATRKLKYIALLFAFLTLVVLIFLLMMQIFGSYFYTNVILFNFQTIDNMFISTSMLLVIFSLGRIFPLLFVIFLILKKQKNILRNNPMVVFISLTIIAFLGISHLFILRAGSNINYTYETIFLMFFLLFIILRSSENKPYSTVKIYTGLFFYIVFLFSCNAKIHNYRYNIAIEKKQKTKYFENIENAKKIKSIVNNETVFFPNMEYALFSKNCNLIYGYDYNIGRFISLVLPININTRLVFFDSKQYDDDFKNGNIKYIINETNKDDFMKKNYPNYTKQNDVGNLSVYSFK